MKLTIIGAGNMGGAIARGLRIASDVSLTVVDPSPEVQADFKSLGIQVAPSITNSPECIVSDVVIVAVKPWYVQNVMQELTSCFGAHKPIVVSVAAGVPLSELESWCPGTQIVRVIPNTAVSVRQSMTFIVPSALTQPQATSSVSYIFTQLGEVEILQSEALLNAGMQLASCGIAYALRYVRAATQGGIELGMREDVARKAIAQTLIGAAELLLQNNTHPEIEIDRVTTPGGITIKGLNAMEAAGFSNSVIAGLLSSSHK